MTKDVFISHASEDQEAAQAVCSLLEKAGLSCWIALRDVPPATPYGAEIIRALNSCKVLLVMLSASSNESSQVATEVERAHSKELGILVVRIEEATPSADLEYHLSNTQWIDAFPQRIEDYFPEILQAAKTLMSAVNVPRIRHLSLTSMHKLPQFFWSKRTALVLAIVVAALIAGVQVHRWSSARQDKAVIQRLEEMSREHYLAGLHGDKARLLSFYDFPLRWYYGEEYVERSQVVDELERYYGRWKERQADLISLQHIGGLPSQGKLRIRYVYRYSFVTHKGNTLQGESQTDLEWESASGKWKIKATYERVKRYASPGS